MTIPIERSIAIACTEQFLMDLLDPKKTPRVPQEIRDHARKLLKHYPSKFYMGKARKLAPTVFGDAE